MPRGEQKQQTRQRILEAAGRSFRREGFDGVGVDGVSKEAGVTSGAFYVHFGSKAAAFRESVVQGVAEVLAGVRQLQAQHGAGWWREFVRFYLGEKRKCELARSCGLQSLTPEVARADGLSRSAFTAELRKVAEAIAAGPQSAGTPATTEEAYAALSALIGAVTLARAVDDAALAQGIAAAAERALLPAPAKPARSRRGR
jgi:TetR/AcrR family transcriptional regulator, transcriptional repressor for nem operon